MSRQVFLEDPASPELLTFINPSQLEVTYGGTAPKVTQFWPPIMPEEVEKIDGRLDLVEMAEYDQFLSENPSLTPMPTSLRQELLELENSPPKITSREDLSPQKKPYISKSKGS